MRRGVESFSFSLANQLSNENKFKIIIYSWRSNNKIKWGCFNKNIKIRVVPFFK